MFHLITWSDANWLTAWPHIQNMYVGKGQFTSRLGWSRQGAISSHSSEQCTIENSWLVCFYKFPFNIFRVLTTVANWNWGKWSMDKAGLLYWREQNLSCSPTISKMHLPCYKLSGLSHHTYLHLSATVPSGFSTDTPGTHSSWAGYQHH
jgi:hypothetical protein